MQRDHLFNIQVVSVATLNQAIQYESLPLDQFNAYLRKVRADKVQEINEARIAADQSYFVYQGKRIACDATSRNAIRNANDEINNLGSLPAVLAGGWKAQDNTFISITTVQEWRAMHSALYEHGAKNFLKAQYLKDLFTTMISVEDINAIQWHTTPTPYDDPVEEVAG